MREDIPVKKMVYLCLYITWRFIRKLHVSFFSKSPVVNQNMLQCLPHRSCISWLNCHVQLVLNLSSSSLFKYNNYEQYNE